MAMQIRLRGTLVQGSTPLSLAVVAYTSSEIVHGTRIVTRYLLVKAFYRRVGRGSFVMGFVGTILFCFVTKNICSSYGASKLRPNVSMV